MSIFNTIKNTLLPHPYKKEVERFKKATNAAREQRLADFTSRKSFVLEGKQWSRTDALERENSPLLTLNYSEDYVDRFLARLFPRNPRTNVLEVGAKSHETDKEKRTKYEKEIFRSYRKNKIAEKLLEQGVNFLAGGAACLYFPSNIVTREAHIISLDPTRIWIEWEGDRIKAFAFEDLLLDEKGGTVKRLTYWDKKVGFVLENDKLVAQTENKDRIIPLAWIPNRPLPHTHEGKPKVDSIRGLDQDLNERVSDWSKRIWENTDPHLAVFSDKNVGVKRGRKKITNLGKDDEMKYIEVPDGSDIKTYVDFMVDTIKTKMSLIDSAGTVKAAISGVSLAYQYSDMLDQIGFMRLYWDTAFRDLNRAILTYRFGLVDGDYDTDPIYHPALQQDSKARTEEYGTMIDKKIISRRDAIDELRGSENADEKLKEIIEEEKLFSVPQEKVINK